MSLKVGDEFTVPLCRAHHRELHQGGNELSWWHDMGIDPLEVARQLRAESEERQLHPDTPPASKSRRLRPTDADPSHGDLSKLGTS